MAKLEWNTSKKNVRKGLILDAIGGGLCKKHGEFFGYGKYGLKECPFCDIDEHYKNVRDSERRIK